MPRKSKSDSLKSVIRANAAEISRLRSRIDETFKDRDKNPGKREEWKCACKDFHLRYQALAFPGGERSAAARILAGDEEAVEAALCFVELRPYFFRSGYMYQDFLRKLNRAPLSRDQAARLASVKEAYHAWKVAKRAARGA
jgi:hypothetical protein